jgi:hypothetical protein
MTKIEDIVYDAIDLGVREELFSKVKKLRYTNDMFYSLYELYQMAFD